MANDDLHRIRIGLDTPLVLPGMIPIGTDFGLLPKRRPGEFSEFHDRIRYNFYEYGEEKKLLEQVRLAPDLQTVVRCLRDLNSVVKEIMDVPWCFWMEAGRGDRRRGRGDGDRDLGLPLFDFYEVDGR